MKIPKNSKNIYVQALWISMSTYAAGIFFGFVGAYGGGDILFWVMQVLIWPRFILVEANYYFFDRLLMDSTFYDLVVQYLGYLALLFVIRYIRKKKQPS